MAHDSIDAALSVGRSGWQRLGTHSIRFEAPDIVFLRVLGDVTPEHIRHLFKEVRRLSSRSGTVCWLIDLTYLGQIPLETRKAAMEHGLDGHLRATAIFGANRVQRAIATLTIQASRLTGQPGALYAPRFFAKEAEARAWLEDTHPDREPVFQI
ncbi:STAS/SEC14 domain-containing protein [Chondromyces apiculatus]|uniref:STAS/SEC14 domain-containing protein n=1 Tax=Chondromyces apiculatus DSM 436 TaxID=1192034 RepID=A0A017THR2_9BACT|nr:STAS/SEC14 domain-containing protein [Chondromyces apiculatus]EYF08380.1 Hypothetical protein CAP_4996 [Chondromyces apiculatus DSM 436]